jgi:hypothetical protein
LVTAVEQAITTADVETEGDESQLPDDFMREELMAVAKTADKIMALDYYNEQAGCGCPAVQAGFLDSFGSEQDEGAVFDVWIHAFTGAYDQNIRALTGTDQKIMLKVRRSQ